MKARKSSEITALKLILLFFLLPGNLFSQTRGLKTITGKELRYHLEFLGSREFRGREFPSPELDIATLYFANWARDAGLKPVMPDGSYYQQVPVTVTTVFQPGTKLTLHGTNGERSWYYGKGLGGNFTSGGSYTGSVVFAGLGISDPAKGWDDTGDLDLRGKIVIILDALRPGEVMPTGPYYYFRLNNTISSLRNRGASAVLSVVDPEREAKLRSGFNIFGDIPSGKMDILYDSQKTDFSVPKFAEARPPAAPFGQAEISHEAAAGILGITTGEIAGMFDSIKHGERVAARKLDDVWLRLDVTVETTRTSSRNVLAMVEGTDPVLKNEYIVVCGHPDGLGLREGEVLPGADDNCTASVALISIARALLAERTKRSVIIAWFTGEEKMMNGSHYFINNCPVAVQKISACLNMDMIGRNSTDSLYLVASDLLSSELDESIRRVSRKSGLNFGFDYRYSNLTNPEQVYFRSDHFPFVRFGIPSVWYFSGFTPDYHSPRDGTGAINWEKFLRITKLVYLTAADIGNKKEMLKLDVNPKVTSRGSQNMQEPSLYKFGWK